MNPTTTMDTSSASLVRLLGDTRAAIVSHLRTQGSASVSELAGMLGISEVATRRHVTVLEEDGFIWAQVVRQARGRPAARYALTEGSERLFPQRYGQLASEVLDFLTQQHGREGLLSFLRWRMDRETAGLGDVVTAQDLHDRLDQLAASLSDAGFEAKVESTGEGFNLVQNNCTIADVAREHPEVCAYEAAAFSQVLGSDVALSRRDTLATGAAACVCTVAATRSSTSETRRETNQKTE